MIFIALKATSVNKFNSLMITISSHLTGSAQKKSKTQNNQAPSSRIQSIYNVQENQMGFENFLWSRRKVSNYEDSTNKDNLKHQSETKRTNAAYFPPT